MITELSRLVRDPNGVVHKPGTAVEVMGEWRELGTHRTLLKVIYGDTKTPGLLLPSDIRVVRYRRDDLAAYLRRG